MNVNVHQWLAAGGRFCPAPPPTWHCRQTSLVLTLGCITAEARGAAEPLHGTPWTPTAGCQPMESVVLRRCGQYKALRDGPSRGHVEYLLLCVYSFTLGLCTAQLPPGAWVGRWKGAQGHPEVNVGLGSQREPGCHRELLLLCALQGLLDPTSPWAPDTSMALPPTPALACRGPPWRAVDLVSKAWRRLMCLAHARCFYG